MNVLTIGGATRDTFIEYSGADTMEITKEYGKQCYTIFESGEKIEVENIRYFSGGGATNTAVSFARLGYQVACFSKIGADSAGEAILSQLAEHGINTSAIIQDSHAQTGNSFIINARSGERTIFAHRGANGLLSAQDIPTQAIEQADLLYITSLSDNSSHILQDIVAHARKHAIPIAINPGISQLRDGTLDLKESLAGIQTLILNSAEARIFMLALVKADSYYQQTLRCLPSETHCSPQTLGPMPRLLQDTIAHENLLLSTRNFFKEIFNLGTKTVVITDGCHGVYVATQQGILFHPALECSVIDTVGAGDAFGSCFIASLYNQESHETALRYGMINSASVIGAIGAKDGLLSLDKITGKAQRLPNNIVHYPL